MKLTAAQLNHFNTFGFLVVRECLTEAEMLEYSFEFNRAIDAIGRVKKGSNTGHYAMMVGSRAPLTARLMEDPRFFDVASQLLGAPVLCAGAGGHLFSGDTRWHPDHTRELTHEVLKFCIYPDALSAKSGALRVIPGSHLQPWSESFVRKSNLEIFGVAGDEVPSYVFESTPGDMLVFNGRLWHAAFGGRVTRRQGAIVYYSEPRSEQEAKDLKTQLAMSNTALVSKGVWDADTFATEWQSIKDPSPRRRGWIERMRQLEHPSFQAVVS